MATFNSYSLSFETQAREYKNQGSKSDSPNLLNFCGMLLLGLQPHRLSNPFWGLWESLLFPFPHLSTKNSEHLVEFRKRWARQQPQHCKALPFDSPLWHTVAVSHWWWIQNHSTSWLMFMDFQWFLSIIYGWFNGYPIPKALITGGLPQSHQLKPEADSSIAARIVALS